MSVGTEVLEESVKICLEVAHDYLRAVSIAGKLVFERERWYHRVLHNEIAYAGAQGASVFRAQHHGPSEASV